eukprot:10350510-Alexandrium_andersonii.AAC.1
MVALKVQHPWLTGVVIAHRPERQLARLLGLSSAAYSHQLLHSGSGLCLARDDVPHLLPVPDRATTEQA